MRVLAFFLLLATLLIAYADPPHDAVLANNKALAEGNLSAVYAASLPSQTPRVDDPFAYAGARLLLAMPGVDDRISANDETLLLWVWAADYPSALTGPIESGICPDVISLTLRDAPLTGAIVFTFRNLSSIASLSNSTAFLLPIPMASTLAESNGTETLSITLDAELELAYDRLVTPRFLSDGSCISGSPEFDTVTFVRSFSDRLDYTVEVGPPRYFLARPVLREQWYRNNQFQLMVASRTRFYRAELWANNYSLGSIRFYDFDVRPDAYGLQRIQSIEKPLAVNLSAVVYPTAFSHPPVFGDENFSYLYVFNSTYEGQGLHRFRFTAVNDFGHRYSYDADIASRALSAGNITETGETGALYARPSSALSAPLSYPLVVPIGGGILLLLFLRWRTK